ncbi:MAG: LysR family transcriptional regulator [Alcanivorax sp.]|nr:LysR family transcriptional regulator [Alcanivorax sp.]
MFASFPVASLRAYEALARTLNAKEAGKELGVTPSAVYHQVRMVEEWLGVPLFFRKHRKMALSDAGQRFYSVLHNAFLDISVCVSELSPKPQPGTVLVSMPSAFAEFWLVPRLDTFYRSHPEVTLQLEIASGPPDLSREARIDVLICDVGTDTAGLVEHALLTENLGVYGSAAQVARASYVPSALLALPEQVSPECTSGWPVWIRAAGETWLGDGVIWREYAQPTLALQAAIAGQGLILASTALVSDSVAQGRLMPYMPDVTLAGAGYLSLTLPGRERHPPTRLFLDWLSEAFNSAAPHVSSTLWRADHC